MPWQQISTDSPLKPADHRVVLPGQLNKSHIACEGHTGMYFISDASGITIFFKGIKLQIRTVRGVCLYVFQSGVEQGINPILNQQQGITGAGNTQAILQAVVAEG
jgi:hypothetical protein